MLIVRVIFAIIQVVLGFILLTDLSFVLMYRPVYPFAVQFAGLSPLNSSLTKVPNFNETVEGFTMHWPGVLTNTQSLIPITPLCSGPNCQSYFLPGKINYNPNFPTPKASEYPNASLLAQIGAPGYQLDFEILDADGNSSITMEDCVIYGIDAVAAQICFKAISDDSILTGISQWSSLLKYIKSMGSLWTDIYCY